MRIECAKQFERHRHELYEARGNQGDEREVEGAKAPILRDRGAHGER